MFNFLRVKKYVASNGAVLPHNGRQFEFSEKVTIITGENESGKSTILELLDFALWGVTALRRSAKAYKAVEVIVGFTLTTGKSYTVERSLKDAKLCFGEEVLAVGVTAVNKAIINLFKYDRSIYTVANYCGQDKVNILGAYLPAERRNLIEATIGLNQIDLGLNFIKEQLTKVNKQQAFLMGRKEQLALSKPEFEYKDGQEYSEVTFALTEDAVADITEALQELRDLKVKLDATVVGKKPIGPVMPDIVQTYLTVNESLDLAKIRLRIEQMQAKANARKALLKQREDCLKSPFLRGNLPKPTEEFIPPEVTQAATEAQNKKAQLVSRLNSLTLPSHSKQELDQFVNQHSLNDAVKAKLELQSMGTVKCPSCATTFFQAHEGLQKYRLIPDSPVSVPITLKECYRQLGLVPNLEIKAEVTKQLEQLEKDFAHLLTIDVAKAEKVRYNWHIYQSHLSGKEEAEKRLADCEAELKLLPNAETIDSDLQYAQALLDAANTYSTSQMRYEIEEKFYLQNVERRAVVENEMNTRLSGCLSQTITSYSEDLYHQVIASLEKEQKEYTNLLNVFLEYNSAKLKFEAHVAKTEELEKELALIASEKQDLTNAQNGLLEAKESVKSYLLPALNTLASRLVYEMSAGKHFSAGLTDSYEMQLDDTELAAFSGSAKSIANLAVRIALGQVLTNGIFSVFIGDELDGGMSETRSQQMFDCLRRVQSSVKQVFIVTHKRPVGDNYIEL